MAKIYDFSIEEKQEYRLVRRADHKEMFRVLVDKILSQTYTVIPFTVSKRVVWFLKAWEEVVPHKKLDAEETAKVLNGLLVRIAKIQDEWEEYIKNGRVCEPKGIGNNINTGKKESSFV